MSTDNPTPTPRLTLRIYTFAHRLPQSIGTLPGGVRLPWVVGLQQFVVFVGTALMLFQTRAYWAKFGLLGNALVLIGMPLLFAWLARAAKLQGRGLVRGMLGLAGLVYAAATGHPQARGRGTRTTGTRTQITGRLMLLPDPAPAPPAAVTEPSAVAPPAQPPMTAARPTTATTPATAAPGMPQGRRSRPPLIEVVAAATTAVDRHVDHDVDQPVDSLATSRDSAA